MRRLQRSINTRQMLLNQNQEVHCTPRPLVIATRFLAGTSIPYQRLAKVTGLLLSTLHILEGGIRRFTQLCADGLGLTLKTPHDMVSEK